MSQLKSTLRLDMTESSENFFTDTKLLGVSAAVKSYQFCWMLNFYLGYNFRLNPNNQITMHKGSRTYFFNVYEEKSITGNENILYHNHCDGEFLLPELSKIDFIWMIRGKNILEQQYKSIFATLKMQKAVLLVTALEIASLKNKLNLLL